MIKPLALRLDGDQTRTWALLVLIRSKLTQHTQYIIQVLGKSRWHNNTMQTRCCHDVDELCHSLPLHCHLFHGWRTEQWPLYDICLFAFPVRSRTTHDSYCMSRAIYSWGKKSTSFKAHLIILKAYAQLEYSEYTPQQIPTGTNKVLPLSFFVLETR